MKYIKGFNENKLETQLVSAFPGCGKSHYFRNTDKVSLDSDSSTFDKEQFPQNYMDHIRDNIGKADVIMISSHDIVRDALVENGFEFTLVYPDKSLKDDYIERYIERGSPQGFIDLITKNWDQWIDELQKQKGCEHIVLKDGQYISDVIK